MKNITLILFFFIAVAGCGKRVAPTTFTSQKDSVTVKYIPRVDTVKIAGEKVTVDRYILCDTVRYKPFPMTASARGKKATVKVKIDNAGKLTVTGGCDSLEAVVRLMDKEIFRLRHDKKETVVVEKEYVTRWYDPPARFIAVVSILFCVGYVVIKLKLL